MEYYSAINRNELMIHATTQMMFENMLYEGSPHRRSYNFIGVTYPEEKNLQKQRRLDVCLGQEGEE